MVREKLNDVTDLADEIHELEEDLVYRLQSIDQNQLYVRYGYNSLSGFCRYGLKFSKTQTQRIVTRVRRLEPTANFPDRRWPDSLGD